MAPTPAVTVQLSQSGPTRTLLVTNPFARGLGYRVLARKRGSRKETELPVSSVRSGQQSVMTLGEPFDELAVRIPFARLTAELKTGVVAS
jgi:hypothetical protein